MSKPTKLYLARVCLPRSNRCHWFVSRFRDLGVSSPGVQVLPSGLSRLLNRVVDALGLPVPAFEMFVTDGLWDANRYVVGSMSTLKLNTDVVMTVKVVKSGVVDAVANGTACKAGLSYLGLLTQVALDETLNFALVPTLAITMPHISSRHVREVAYLLSGATYFVRAY